MSGGTMSVAPKSRPIGAAAAVAATVICALAAVIAWDDAHVTYALPNNVGHDVLGGGIAVAALAAVAAVVAAVATVRTIRRQLSPKACVLTALIAVLVTVVALVLFENAPSAAY